jgi:hypothetical protein
MFISFSVVGAGSTAVKVKVNAIVVSVPFPTYLTKIL